MFIKFEAKVVIELFVTANIFLFVAFLSSNGKMELSYGKIAQSFHEAALREYHATITMKPANICWI